MSGNHLVYSYLLAIRTATEELQKVPFSLKPTLLRQPLLQFAEVTVGEVNDFTTIRADEVMVML